MSKLPEFNTEDNNIRFIIESAFAKLEKANTRLWVICLILILALIGTNAGWIWYESQWQYVESTTVTQDVDAKDGGEAIINDGVHINGESETNSSGN